MTKNIDLVKNAIERSLIDKDEYVFDRRLLLTPYDIAYELVELGYDRVGENRSNMDLNIGYFKKGNVRLAVFIDTFSFEISFLASESED